MKKVIFAALALAILSSQSASAQELPICPKGAVGEWEWNATAERTRIYYKRGTWNLGPDVDLPQEQKPVIELTEIAEKDREPRAYFNIRFYPNGLTVPLKGQEYRVFSDKPHPYRIGIAPQGGNIAIDVTTDWKTLSRYSLGLFGDGATVKGADGPKILKDLLKRPGMSGLFVFPPADEGVDEEPIAFLVLPEDGRAAAWDAAAVAHKTLSETVDKGPGCKMS
ncbi:hypothetical protein [Pontixanthobacter sp. CEM42]|uniref:hypothetical protein n=1 Tax=Pontixanthobacter sp. CEM42 TaxID=2792077 RepID=UPI001AE006C3|nr:hypothetical protein [Pontixanthobacter sp. CEM42]